LGLQDVKGTLNADADLLVLDAVECEDGNRRLVVEKVFKFGVNVFDLSDNAFGA
jgi:N-acetylglucosamine-6-phosphate deacetylase